MIQKNLQEPVCFVACDGEVLRPLGEIEVADTTTVYQIEMAAETIASGTSGRPRRSVQCSIVKCVRLDADNMAMLDDCSVLAD